MSNFITKAAILYEESTDYCTEDYFARSIRDAFEAGAEFGFEKALEEAQRISGEDLGDVYKLFHN